MTDVHQASYQGKYEEVKEKVLADNSLLTATDDVSIYTTGSCSFFSRTH